MPDTRFGVLVDANRAVKTYVREHLAVAVLAPDAEPALQLEVHFSRFLRDRGVEEDLASELSAEQYELVRRKVDDHVAR
jgi:hypothetical protein